MKMRNVHQRTIPAPVEQVAALLGTLGSAADRFWPHENWPPVRFDRTLQVGALGEHGTGPYEVVAYAPDAHIRFEFRGRRNGFHAFTLEALGDGCCLLRHSVEATLALKAIPLWFGLIRPLHDALIEDLLDKVEAQFASPRHPHAWSLPVKWLRRWRGLSPARRPCIDAVADCETPSCSAIDRRWVEAAYFRDAYRAPLLRANAGIVEIFRGIFAHHPWWMKLVLIVRNRIAAWCGLDAATAEEMLRFECKSSYAVGDKLGVWPIFALADAEVIVGRDNKHLDFRLSVLKEVRDDTGRVVVSTFCVVHNAVGKLYLFFVVPFHRWGLRRLLWRAAAAGRL